MRLRPRQVEEEWLDRLPPESLEARRSRSDLRRVNAWMGNARILAEALRALPLPDAGITIADLGGGDGALMLEVARRLNWRKVELLLVDQFNLLQAETQEAFARAGWRARAVPGEVRTWLSGPAARTDLTVANLFLHHFQDEPLRDLLGSISAKARFMAACEPRRSNLAPLACRMLWLIGCNRVTRHDAILSVQAGFADRELTRLWPCDPRWTLQERKAGLFSHLFVAARPGPSHEHP